MLLLPLCVALAAAAAPLQDSNTARPVQESLIRPGDRVVLVGNVTAERMQHDGWLELLLRVALLEHRLSFRNLGFSGDELTVRQRTDGFGTPEEWLDRTQADVVLAFFGNVEAFAGEPGLADFRADLRAALRGWRSRTTAKGAPTRVALVSPIPHELLANAHLSTGPEVRERNRVLALYGEAMAEIAAEEDVVFLDVLEPMLDAYTESSEPLTLNGRFLNTAGNLALAQALADQLVPGQRMSAAGLALLEELRTSEIAHKNELWFQRYRATDGYNVYGGRSSLEYEGLTNFEVLQRELVRLDAEVARMDEAISDELLGIPPAGASESPEALPELIPVPTNRPGDGPDGAWEFLDGEATADLITPGPGLAVNLFADESRFPELANPVQMAWDTRGRLWVATWPTYPHWRPDEPRSDKLVILEDTDGDGVADESTVFADELVNPTGLEFWNGGVFVGCAPDLLFLEDTDGDDRADKTTRVLHGLSSADTHHGANSFVLGPDGALYFQEGIFHHSQVETPYGVERNHNGCVWRYDPRTSAVERYMPYGFLNPHGHVFDRWGMDFVTDGTGNTNYFALPATGRIDFPARHPSTQPYFQQRSRPAAATEILSSEHFPKEFQGDLLIANVIGFQGIFRYQLTDAGSGFGAEEEEPLLQGSDPNFRPVDIEVGPDGAVYFLDWHNPLIGHMQHHLRDPSRDREHGRVYRVTAEGRPLSEPARIDDRDVLTLVELLGHSESRVRYRARIELSARDTAEVLEVAEAWAAVTDLDDTLPAEERDHRLLEALWITQQHGAVSAGLLDKLLVPERDPRARAAATQVLRRVQAALPDSGALLARLVEDEHPRVRLAAVVALSEREDAAAAATALRVQRHAMDRYLDYALAETLRQLEPAWRAALTSGEPFLADDPAGLAHLLAELDTDELLAAYPSPERARELLARHGVELADARAALDQLARSSGRSVNAEWLDVVQRADERSGEHTDHLLMELFRLGAALPHTTDDGFASDLGVLADRGRRTSTRRMATAAQLRVGSDPLRVWDAAASSPDSLLRVLEAAPYVDDAEAAAVLLPRALALVETDTAQAEHGGAHGRYVRIELPGAERTLTLAEVEVWSGGANVARGGTATQSTVNWGGTPEKALDGNRSGKYGDGGQTHTVEDMPDPWWEVDLGAEQPLERVLVFGRNEAGGQYRDRLDGFVLRVLDGERRTVFEATTETAPEEAAAFELESPAARVRRAAIGASAALAVTAGRERDVEPVLLAHFAEPDLRSSVVAALRTLAADGWDAELAARTGALLLAHFESAPAAEFETRHGRELLALADELSPVLSDPLAGDLARVRRGLGPFVIVLRPVPDALQYDRYEFTVQAGRSIELVFDNTDIMPHNLVVTAPGALAKVGRAAEAMAMEPDAWERNFLPDLDEVLEATNLLQPGQSETLRFRAPETPDDYPYVCTFPGHWIRMNGVMHVVPAEAELEALAEVEAAAAVQRTFVANWELADLAPRLAEVDELDDGAPERGRAVFEAASCHRCHTVNGEDGPERGSERGQVAPEMVEVVQRHDREALLAQILEPSLQILPEFATEFFELGDGSLYVGRVVGEGQGQLTVQVDPYGEEFVDLPLDEIVARDPAQLSNMPSGLLSTMERAEILDLLSYLESLKPAAAGDSE